MEICGGQTHSIVRHGIDQMLPAGVTLLHGPGCPVCVTPAESIDAAVAIAADPSVIFCSFGDMLRVPGHEGSLLAARARGADVRMVYSPLDALTIARETPDRQVVFFAIGFETTAPATAMTVAQAARDGIENFSLLVSHVLVPPAIEALLERARQSGARLPGGGPCLHRHGLLAVRADRPSLRRADRCDRVRTDRSAARHVSCASASLRQAAPRWRTRTADWCGARATARRRT